MIITSTSCILFATNYIYCCPFIRFSTFPIFLSLIQSASDPSIFCFHGVCVVNEQILSFIQIIIIFIRFRLITIVNTENWAHEGMKL